jgi:hypothetical protein
VAEIIEKLWMNKVTLYWIPGHLGFIGNGKADKLVKATTRPGSAESLLIDICPWFLVKQALKKVRTATGSLLAGGLDAGKFTKKIDISPHLGKAARLYQQSSNSEVAVFAQLRTGKSFLNTIYISTRST